MPLQLDWMNLFGGLTSGQVVSVVVVAIIFTAAAGLTILGLIAFGVRSGLMAPGYTSRVPSASDVELGAFLLAAAFGMIAVLLMVFLGLAENDLDNPIFLPFSVACSSLPAPVSPSVRSAAVGSLARADRNQLPVSPVSLSKRMYTKLDKRHCDFVL